MKKSLIVANVVIFSMFAMLIGVSVSNAQTISTLADSRVIYSGDQSKNNVCFMVNVYQGNEYVLDMLEILDAYNVKTTFFVGGCWAVNNLDVVKEIYARGHEIGNHGFYHKDQDSLNFEENVQEIEACHNVLEKNLGIKMHLFAPPSGAYNLATVDAATSLGYSTIMWTHDTIDWRDQDANLIFKRATRSLANGNLVLMHPTKASVEAFANIISFAINSGFNVTTVSNCL